MSETLLDLVKQALNEVMVGSQTLPQTVIGNTDEFTQGMLSMAQSAGRDLARRYEWGDLIQQVTFPTIAGQSDYLLPPDFFRMVNDTAWDTSTNWRMLGPLTPQGELWLRDSVGANVSTYRQYRQIGNRAIRITPTPPDTSVIISFEYLSRNWVVSQGGALTPGNTMASNFASDFDTTIFDFDLMVKSMKWRWRAAKGYDAAETKAEYDEALSALISADQGGGVLNFGVTDWSDGGEAFAGSPNYAVTGPSNDPWASGYGWSGANTVIAPGSGTTTTGTTTTTGSGTTTTATSVPVDQTPPSIIDSSVAVPVDQTPPSIIGS